MNYRIVYPNKVDLSQFAENCQNPEIKYGLPKEVLFCKKCVISNQRPNSSIEFKHTKNTAKKTIFFDDNGVCDACRLAEHKHNVINWQDREAELIELCNRFRNNNGYYDCLVSGSGGKDSFYAAHVLRYKYGMNPLTATWSPHIYTPWGWNNFQSWIHAGFDNVLFTPNGKVHRLLTRLAMDKLLHPFQPFILGQKSLAPKIAALYKIPLVFFGENEAEYGNPIKDSTSAKRDRAYFAAANKSEIYLGGVSILELLEDFGLTNVDLEAYMPMDPNKIEEEKIEVHYLGYYLKWHPQSCYYYSVEHGGFQPSPERTPGTYSKYNSIDDKIDDFHYHTTHIKFGIGRATYDAAQEIRSGDITREEGVSLVHRFDGEFPERFCDEIFRYLSIPVAQFPEASPLFENPILDRTYYHCLADNFRSPHLWQNKNGKWSLRYMVESENAPEVMYALDGTA